MSNRKKRLGLIVFSIVIASFLTGLAVGVYSNGGTPTIDELTGISGLPWLNATTGINAPEFYLNSEDKTDLLEYPIETVSYTIFNEGSLTKSKNGTTGKIDYSGTDAATVIQNTINAMNPGQHLHICAGKYRLYSQLDVNKTIKITGESGITTYGTYGTRIQSNIADNIIHIAAGGVALLDLWIDGLGSPSPLSGIFIDDPSTSFTIERVKVIGVATGAGITISRWNGELSGCALVNNKIGLQLLTNANNIRVFGGVFTSNVVDAYLIHVDGGQQLQVFGTDLEGVQSSTKGIYIDSYNSFINLFGVRFENLHTAIEWVQGRGDSIISPIFAGTLTNLIVNMPNSSLITSTYNYITENSGVLTLLNGNTEVNVTHGCDYTPSAGDISVTAIENLGSASFWWFEKITSTTFEINLNINPGQDVDFAWNVDRRTRDHS